MQRDLPICSLTLSLFFKIRKNYVNIVDSDKLYSSIKIPVFRSSIFINFSDFEPRIILKYQRCNFA